MGTVAFGDETYDDPRPGRSGFYQLTAALIDGRKLTYVRRKVVSAAPHYGFHATDEARNNPANVARMLECAANPSDCRNVITVMTSSYGPMEPIRQACLTAMLLEFDRLGVETAFFDSREDTRPGKNRHARNQHDLRTLTELKQRGQISSTIRLAHRHDHQERLLYLPDAVGWAYRRFHRQGEDKYWTLVAPATTVLTLP